MVRVEAKQLFVKVFFQIIVFFNVYNRTFRHEADTAAVSLFQSFPEDLFAAGVDICGIEIVYAAVDRSAYDFYCLGLVLRKSHASEAEARDFHSRFSEIYVFHYNSNIS